MSTVPQTTGLPNSHASILRPQIELRTSRMKPPSCQIQQSSTSPNPLPLSFRFAFGEFWRKRRELSDDVSYGRIFEHFERLQVFPESPDMSGCLCFELYLDTG